jgi:hypothetical protein
MAVDTQVATKAHTVGNNTHRLPKAATEGRQEVTADRVAPLPLAGLELNLELLYTSVTAETTGQKNVL